MPIKIKPYHGYLRSQYKNLAEFYSYNEIYDNARRLGFRTVEDAWERNSQITMTVRPEDYNVVGSNMRIEFARNSVTISRVGSKLYSDSTLLHHLKKELILRGYDVIKKRMAKDGHMMDDEQPYIRSRKINAKGAFCIYQNDYAICTSYPKFNDGITVTLTVDDLREDLTVS